MLTIQLTRTTRTTRTGKAVKGKIIIPLEDNDGNVTNHTFDTLENADYLIPAGTYTCRLTWSTRFKKKMPLLENVPGREGIRIHMGTKPEHSHGCILMSYLGLEYVKTLFNQRYKWYDEDGFELEIRDEQG